MGFLYQVLKDVSEKQPYKVGKTILNDIVTELGKRLSTGREGFKVIEQVAERVGEYNGRVKNSNDEVKNKITTLNAQIITTKDEVTRILHDENTMEPVRIYAAIGKVDRKRDECLGNAETFRRGILSLPDNVNDLNNDCKTKVHNALKCITYEGKRLADLSTMEKENMMSMITNIKQSMENLRKSVNEEICNILGTFATELRKLVTEIRKKLATIYGDSVRYVGELNKWIHTADGTMTTALGKVSNILEEVIDSDQGPTKHKKDLYNAAKELRGKSEVLYRAGEDAKRRVRSEVEKAKNAINGLEHAYKKKLFDVKYSVEAALNEVHEQIKELCNAVGKAGGTTVQGVVQHINTTVQDILNGGGKAGIAGIVVAAEEYVARYAVSFESTVQRWVTEVVDDEMVKNDIWMYVDHNNGKRNFEGNMVPNGGQPVTNMLSKVIHVFTQQATDHIKQILRRANPPRRDENNLQTTLTSINDFLADVAKNTNPQKELDNLVQRIEGELHSDSRFRLKQPSELSDKIDLENAAKLVLRHVSSNAKQAGEEIKNFIQRCQVGTIMKIRDAASSLYMRLNKATGSVVDSAIKNVTTDVNKFFHGDAEVSVKQFLERDSSYEQLVGAIGVISSHVRDALKDIMSINTQAGHQFQLVTFKLSALCKAIKDAADDPSNKGLKQILTDFQTTTLNGNTDKTQLKKIHDDLLGLLGSRVTEVLNDTENFTTKHAPRLEETCAVKSTEFISSQISSALSTLTTAARRNYVSSVKQLLTAFADKVEKELEGLPGEIAKDLTIGFKGLMKTLEDGNMVPGALHKNIEKLTEVKNAKSDTGDEKKEAFKKLSEKFKDFAEPLFLYLTKEAQRVHSENNGKKNPRGTDPQHYSQAITKIRDVFNILLDDLHKKHRYDHKVHNLLDNLSDAVSLLVPKGFAMPNSPVIDGLPSGVTHFVGELEKVYISTYDGQKYEKDVYIYKHRIDTKGKVEIDEVTEYGKNCAKVFLTSLATLSNDLVTLGEKCKGSQFQTIYASNEKITNVLGDYLISCGYKVSMSRESHEGQLRNEPMCEGQAIYLGKLNEEIKTAVNLKQVKAWKEEQKKENKFTHPRDANSNKINLLDILDYLQYCLETYYQVRHISTFSAKKRPCSVYEMLCWLSGMPCNNAYEELLGDGLSDPFKDPRRQTKEVEGEIAFTVETPESLYLDASPKTMKYANTVRVVRQLCPISHDILTTLLGYGDAETTYAVDFSSNAMNLHYPQKGEDCLQMLLDILCRLLPQLRYVHEKCKLSTEHGGWYSCKYGKGIKTSKWPCTEHSNDEPKGKATCQPKSPLQSYLNDCLPGHLPHRVESIGCNAVCKTCPKSTPGMPCLTPLGFRGFSGSTKKGEDICSVLSKFLNEVDISCLFALSVKPPRTLPEHFGFTLSLVNGWHTSKKQGFRNALQDSFDNAIHNLSIQLAEKQGTLPDELRKAYGSDQESHSKHEEKSADLASLSLRMPCPGADNYCAPYISTSCVDIYNYLPYKHAGLYLSWAIYLPWTFWDLLNNLYNAFCSINCQDWGCRGCLRGDKCKKGEHGVVDEEKPSSICQCRSIVDCKGVAPTLYQYGFVFGEASTLNDNTSPKKCSDFCSQLKNVLKSKYFEKLFEECDNFLWTIRTPFSYLVLALWLLSLLYLTHIMVIRLDLLHIKSHLHSPSSHRIAAQSLLAAARVNKLNGVFYLQP